MFPHALIGAQNANFVQSEIPSSQDGKLRSLFPTTSLASSSMLTPTALVRLLGRDPTTALRNEVLDYLETTVASSRLCRRC